MLRCAGFSLQWLLLLQSTGSRHMGFSSCGSRALECRLSSCGARAHLLHGMWDLPGPGLEPVSPALVGRFLTTEPPGKPSFIYSSVYLLIPNSQFIPPPPFPFGNHKFVFYVCNTTFFIKAFPMPEANLVALILCSYMCLCMCLYGRTH